MAKAENLISLSSSVREKLREYRKEYNEWQQFMHDKYGNSVTDPDDVLLLCFALDDGIGCMREMNQKNRTAAGKEEQC